jgi:hypothetical protein
MGNIEVLTIALSPELCGGWDNSLRVARLIIDHLQINFDLNLSLQKENSITPK